VNYQTQMNISPIRTELQFEKATKKYIRS